MPAPTLTVHIGAPKTGTTWIQRFLYENREALLREQGVLYPDVSLRGYGHHDIAFLVGGGYPHWAIPQPRSLEELQSDLARAVAGHRGDLLISSEDFYLFPNPMRLRQFLQESGASAGRQVRILVYVRRQDDAHESWYNQTVKAQGESHGIATCIERDVEIWDYHRRLAPWTQAFGHAAMVVRPYDPAGYVGGDLRSDFLHHAGIRDQGLAPVPVEVNWSLNRDLLAFQRVINYLPLKPVHKRRWHRQLMELSRQSAGSGVFDEAPLLSVSMRSAILERYAASNTALARDYLGGREPFQDSQRDQERGDAPGSGLTPGKVFRIVSWLVRHRH